MVSHNSETFPWSLSWNASSCYRIYQVNENNFWNKWKTRKANKYEHKSTDNAFIKK